MIAFQQIWKDVNELVSERKLDFDINLKIENVFIVNDNEDTIFLSREDFLLFWSKLNSSSYIGRENLKSVSSKKELYIYDLFRYLPYIDECNGQISLEKQ